MAVFHWIKVRMFCYSTERTDVLSELMTSMVSEFEEEITEGHHGNQIVIMDSEMTKDRDVKRFFQNLGTELISDVLDEIEDRVDDDCVFHLRLDKQKAVRGEWRIAHHGDVISVMGKVVSHPARKSIATENLRSFLGSL